MSRQGQQWGGQPPNNSNNNNYNNHGNRQYAPQNMYNQQQGQYHHHHQQQQYHQQQQQNQYFDPNLSEADYANFDEIDRALENEYNYEQDMEEMAAEMNMGMFNQNGVGNQGRGGGGGGSGGKYLPAGAVPSQNGVLSKHAAEFWFPECRECTCCKGFKHGCDCCKNGGSAACSQCSGGAPSEPAAAAPVSESTPVAVAPASTSVTLQVPQENPNKFYSEYSSCTCCRGFKHGCKCCEGGHVTCSFCAPSSPSEKDSLSPSASAFVPGAAGGLSANAAAWTPK